VREEHQERGKRRSGMSIFGSAGGQAVASVLRDDENNGSYAVEHLSVQRALFGARYAGTSVRVA
jgi:hypothetical protein